MKKKVYVMATALMLMFSAPSVMASDAKSKPDMTENQKVRISEISQRVEEISQGYVWWSVSFSRCNYHRYLASDLTIVISN